MKSPGALGGPGLRRRNRWKLGAKRSLSVRLSNLRLRARFPFHYGRAQAREPNSGLIVIADAFTVAYRVEITSLAARYRLPAIYPFRLFAEVGGLLSYGVDLTDNFRRAVTYVDRILKARNRASFQCRRRPSTSW